MRSYYRCPADGYTLRINRVFQLDEPAPLLHALDPKGFAREPRLKFPICRPFGFKFNDMEHRLGSRVDFAGGGEQLVYRQSSLREAIASWQFEPRDLDSALTLLIVEPIVELVLLRQWSTLLLRASWRLQPFVDYPDRDWAEETSGKYDAVGVREGEVAFAKVDVLISNLRRWAPRIMDGGREGLHVEDVADEKMALEMSMSLPYNNAACTHPARPLLLGDVHTFLRAIDRVSIRVCCMSSVAPYVCRAEKARSTEHACTAITL